MRVCRGMRLWLVAVVATLLTVCQAYIDYCRMDRDHIMCRYPKAGIRNNCRMVSMTERRKHVILHRINYFRSGVACGTMPNLPSATGMMLLRWHEDLQVVAERWAMQCYTKERNHKCRIRDRDSCKMATGQSREEYFLDEIAIVDQWFDQGIKFPRTEFGSYYDKLETQDVAAMLYDKAVYVGCGLVDPNLKGATAALFCAFTPARRDGAALYDAGTTTSKCPKDHYFHHNYRGLCYFPDNSTAPAQCAPSPLHVLSAAVAATSLAGSETTALAAITALAATAVLPTQALAALTVLLAMALAARAICRCRKEPLLCSPPPPQGSAGERKGLRTRCCMMR